MTGNLGKVIACFKEMGVHPNLGDFSSRLVMQKTVYLLEKMGVNLGYSYGLYVHGPYSPALTRALYGHKDQVQSLENPAPLGEAERKAALKILNATNLKPSQLEIAATLAFFRQEQKMTEDDAVRKLKEIKPFYSDVEVVLGQNAYKLLFYKPTEEDLRWLAKENKALDKLSDEAWSKFD